MADSVTEDTKSELGPLFGFSGGVEMGLASASKDGLFWNFKNVFGSRGLWKEIPPGEVPPFDTIHLSPIVDAEGNRVTNFAGQPITSVYARDADGLGMTRFSDHLPPGQTML